MGYVKKLNTSWFPVLLSLLLLFCLFRIAAPVAAMDSGSGAVTAAGAVLQAAEDAVAALNEPDAVDVGEPNDPISAANDGHGSIAPFDTVGGNGGPADPLDVVNKAGGQSDTLFVDMPEADSQPVMLFGEEDEEESGGVVLTIKGAGLSGPERNFTEAELTEMQREQEIVYSAINTWPTKKWYVGRGVSVWDLLETAAISPEATLVRFTSIDGFNQLLTVSELLEPRYCYPNFMRNNAEGHIPGDTEGAYEVETILSLVSAENTNNPSKMNDSDGHMLMLGQRSVTEETGELFVKYVRTIEVYNSEVDVWDSPRADPAGGAVLRGSQVALTNDRMEGDKIYYTTDGSTPDMNSNLYNFVAKRWWDNRGEATVAAINKPVTITEDTVIKAVTIGPGKRNSPIAEFKYTVSGGSAANPSDSEKSEVIIDDPSVALYIYGSGVSGVTKFSNSDLENMDQVTIVYSAINTYPSKKWYVGKGVKLRDLLNQAGMSSNATLIRIHSRDSFRATLTVDELLNTPRYYFPNFKLGNSDADGHVPGNSGGASLVEPILALQSAESSRSPSAMNDVNAPLFMLGQQAVTEQTGEAFVKNVVSIEIIAESLSRWDNPKATPDSGRVAVGDQIKLSNDRMDNDKIYYTTDGSDPNMNSTMYNYVASRWWSNRGPEKVAEINKPITITGDTVIKAITIGPGKLPSDVVEFRYTVKDSPDNVTATFTPDKSGAVSLTGEASVEAPPGAVNESVEIGIKRLSEPPAAPVGYRYAGGVYEFKVNGQPNYVFNKKVTVKLYFDPDKLAPEESPWAYYYDAANGWTEIGGKISGDHLAVEVDHLGVFALLLAAPDKITVRVKPSEGGVVDLNGEAIVEIPAGALVGNKELDVEIQRLSECPDPPAGWQLLGAAYRLSVDKGTRYKFNQEVTLKLLFDPERLNGEEAPVLYYYNAEEKTWFELAGVITENYIVTEVDHCGIFALLALGYPVDVQVLTTGNQGWFSDITGHWAEAVIARLAGRNAVSGYPDGSFQPDNPITRAEFATVLVNSYNLTGQSRPAFADTTGHWAEEAVGIAMVYGIISGYDAVNFGPDDLITREQMTVMMVRAARLTTDTGVATENSLSFSDSGAVSAWAQEAVSAAVRHGIIQGDPENNFRPQDNATRAEAVQAISNTQ